MPLHEQIHLGDEIIGVAAVLHGGIEEETEEDAARSAGELQRITVGGRMDEVASVLLEAGAETVEFGGERGVVGCHVGGSFRVVARWCLMTAVTFSHYFSPVREWTTSLPAGLNTWDDVLESDP